MKTRTKKKPKPDPDPDPDPWRDILELAFTNHKGGNFLQWIEDQLKSSRSELMAIGPVARLVALREMAALRGKAAQYDEIRERMTETIESCEKCDGEGEMDCPDCDGLGESECDLGHMHDCDACDGTDIVTCDECKL